MIWIKKNWKLLVIIALAAFLRFYNLSSNPPALSWDETAIGWNAKTIFHTRRDEYGTRLPLSFKSFGDYKSPVYIYLTAPIVGLFSMNEFNVRLISVLAGIASVVIIYLLAQELIPKAKNLPLLSALLLAITPWHVLMSRPAFEPNLALMFILLAILFRLKSFKNPKLIILTVLCGVLALYTYHSPKIFLPLLILGGVTIFRKKVFAKKMRSWTITAAILAMVLLFPLVKDTLSSGGSRFQGTSIFYTREGELKPFNLSLASELVKNYFIHYSSQFLFLGGDNIPRIQMRKVGPLLLIQAPFLILGFIYLLKNRQQNWAKFLLWWLIVGPIPAMIGFEVPHPIRSYNLLPALTITSALGLTQLKKPLFKNLVILGFILNTSFFLYRYFIYYPIYSAPDWQYGYKQAALTAKEYEDQVDKIIFTSHYGQPHIFTYFYQNRKPLSVFWGAMIKHTFRDLKWDEDPHLSNVLLIGTPEEIPSDASGIIKEINYPNGEVAFRIVKT